MAEALIKGLIAKGFNDILVSEPAQKRCDYLRAHYQVRAHYDNMAVISDSDIVVVAVKPQNMPELREQLKGADFTGKTIVSIVAGVKIANLRSVFPSAWIVRVMPNTAALVLEAMSALSVDDSVPLQIRDRAEEIFSSIGQVVFLPEEMMDAVTAVSGSGPAFFALFADSVTEAGMALGLSREISLKLAVQTMSGTAKMLSSGRLPEELITMVASPGGTTEAGLKVFEQRGFINIVSEALTAASRRSAELGK